MERFGDQLKQAREERGESLDSIAKKTRISRRYLEALEASHLDALPGGAFDKGYIRSYAEVIGVDPAPYLAGYDAECKKRGPGDEEFLEELSRLVEKRRAPSRFDAAAWRRAIALAIGVLIVAVSLWVVSRRDEAAPPSPTTTRERSQARPSEAVTTPSSSSPAPRAAAASQPEREREPEPAAEPVPVQSSDIRVPDAGVGRGVVERNLVGAGRRFAEGSTVVFWTRVVGANRGATIRHVWRHDGQVMMLSNLTIGGPHWRTFSRLVLPEGSSGGWEVEARDPEGNVLARERFVCLSASPETTGEPAF